MRLVERWYLQFLFVSMAKKVFGNVIRSEHTDFLPMEQNRETWVISPYLLRSSHFLFYKRDDYGRIMKPSQDFQQGYY